MGKLRVGDIVARKSYGCDVFFKVADIRNNGKEDIVTLKGISYRIEADAPASDLEIQSEQKVADYRNKCNRQVEKVIRSNYPLRHKGYLKKAFYRDTSKEDDRIFSRPVKILHIDGDEEYLETCLSEYRKLHMDAVGKYIPEKQQPAAVYKLLQEYKPDILVLTGHDGVIKGDKSYLNVTNYRNSRYFIEAVKEARKYENDIDSLIIFAGACQSMYSEIIKAGANFASSPKRVLIHALDPVLVCKKISFTGVDQIISPQDVASSTITGPDGIGGLQTRGKYRDGFPKDGYKG